MEQILVITVVGLIIVGVIVLVVAAQRKLAAFEKACADRGWLVERNFARGFSIRVSGSTGGVNWVYTFVRMGRSGDSSTNRAQYGRVVVAAAALPDAAVVIVPQAQRSTQMGSMFTSFAKLGDFGRMIVELFVVNALGGDSSDVDTMMALRPVESGSDALRQQFLVLATGEEAAAQVLRRSEGALLDFASNQSIPAHRRQVTVLAWSKGLTLAVAESITDIDYLDALANLAAALANSARGW
jgi:hypothetical protein